MSGSGPLTNEIGSILEYSPSQTVRQLADARNAEAKAALTKAARFAFFVRGGVRRVEMERLEDVGYRGSVICCQTWEADLVASDGVRVDELATKMLAEARLLVEALGEDSTRFRLQFHYAGAGSTAHIFRLYNASFEQGGEAARGAPERARKCDECGAPREGGETHCRYCKTAAG